MHIKTFSAANYRSIFQIDPVELTQGFNIITGQNAAGKTALLELMSLQFGQKPHRSQKTVPNRGDVTDSVSVATVQLGLANRELKRLIRNKRSTVHLPLVDQTSPLAKELGIANWDELATKRFIDWWLQRAEYAFDLRLSSDKDPIALNGEHSFVSWPITRSGAGYLYTNFRLELNGEISFAGNSWGTQPDLGVELTFSLRQLIYRFSSERLIRARAPHGTNPQLAPNAENLPEVLNILQSNAAAFEEFNSLVTEILPQIKWISVRATSGGNEIIIWSIEKNTRRDDLGVPLDETGSGVGQVLAILYVVFTSSDPSTIIIDEPQSFLHPGSAVKLIHILKRYPQHQFILATHSPSIIAAAGPSNIISLTYDGETHLEVFDLNKSASFQSFLATIGLGMQDVFGADNILWVEGPTEHQIFPEIIDRRCQVPLMGTTVVPVSATGDLEGKDAQRIFAMYRTLSRGNPLLPPAVGFILDKETRSQQQIGELVSQSNNLAMFLPRRMFENYLLRPAAIASVMNSIADFREQPVTETEVLESMNNKLKLPELFKPAPVSDDWVKQIHASRLLSRVFAEMSEHRVEYRKPEHSVALARWILENHPDDLDEASQVLKAALQRRA